MFIKLIKLYVLKITILDLVCFLNLFEVVKYRHNRLIYGPKLFLLN